MSRPTPEQYGAADGWRLLDDDEKGRSFDVTILNLELWNEMHESWCREGNQGYYGSSHYRTKLSRAELRTARGLPPEPAKQPPAPPIWIRSTVRPPLDHDLPVLVRGPSGTLHVFTTAPMDHVTFPFLWHSITLPADPEPTQEEKDDKAFESYLASCNIAHVSIEYLRHAWTAGIKHARANPA